MSDTENFKDYREVDVYYKLRKDLDNDKYQTIPIELLQGPLTGLIYRYGRMNADVKGDESLLNFVYQIHENSKINEIDAVGHRILGDVLTSMLMDIFNDEPRTPDTKKSD